MVHDEGMQFDTVAIEFGVRARTSSGPELDSVRPQSQYSYCSSAARSRIDHVCFLARKYQRQGEIVGIELEKLKRDQAETLKKFDLLELENQKLVSWLVHVF